MKIGELAQTTGTAVETIRYYEREGLLPPAERTDSNYRIYTRAHAARLTFIRNCRHLDMTLAEIRELLRLQDGAAPQCAAVNQLLDEHIGHVASRIRELKRLDKELRALRAQCPQTHHTEDCGILQGLSAPAEPQGPRPHATAHPPGTH